MAKRPGSRKKPGRPVRAGSADRLRELQEENRTLKARLSFLDGSQGGLESMAAKVLRIAEITQDLNTLDLDRIGIVATQKIPGLVRARSCSLYLYDYGADELVLHSQSQPRPLTEQVSVKLRRNSVMARVVQTRETLLIPDFDDYEKATGVHLDRPFREKYATGACISAPLQTANFLVGILNLADPEGRAGFDEAADLPAVEQVARVLAMAIRNCKLFREVQSQAHTDALTRLGNYRAFHETLRSEMHRCARYGRPLSLIMLDIDSFKELNDKHGHQAGDYALSELGQVIRTATRREDLAARYGGDEITIILPETKAQGAVMVVQRLIASVRAHEFVFEGNRLPVSISVGISSFRPDLSITQLVGEADQALYRAKQGGRNRFAVAGEA